MWCDSLFRRFWTGAKGLLQCRRKTVVFRERIIVLQAHSGECIQKGWLLVIFVAEEIFFAVRWLKVLNWLKALHFPKNFVLSKKATHSHNPTASLLMSVITYCYQKNRLWICTKLNILFYYAWSSQRFKSLPSILCKIAIHAKPVTCRTPVILSKTPYRPAIWTKVAGRSPGCFLVLFAEAKRINPFPFGNFLFHGKHVPVGRHPKTDKKPNFSAKRLNYAHICDRII